MEAYIYMNEKRLFMQMDEALSSTFLGGSKIDFSATFSGFLRCGFHLKFVEASKIENKRKMERLFLHFPSFLISTQL